MYIQQFTLITRPSGLLLQRHISTVAIESPLDAQDVIDRSGCQIHLEPDTERYGIAQVEFPRRTVLYGVEPQESSVYCRMGSEAIVKAYDALTYCDVPPTVQFESAVPFDDIDEEDRETLQAVVLAVHNRMNGIDEEEPVLAGQYL